MYPFYLGIDLHRKRTYVVLIDAEGEIIDQRRLLNTDMPEYLPQSTQLVLMIEESI